MTMRRQQVVSFIQFSANNYHCMSHVTSPKTFSLNFYFRPMISWMGIKFSVVSACESFIYSFFGVFFWQRREKRKCWVGALSIAQKKLQLPTIEILFVYEWAERLLTSQLMSQTQQGNPALLRKTFLNHFTHDVAVESRQVFNWKVSRWKWRFNGCW